MARPTKQDKTTVKKLEEAFSLGSSIEEACYYAGISKQTYYNWTQQDEELLDRFERLKQHPILLARKTVVQAIQSDPRLAFKYLERKRKDEFGTRVEVAGGSITLEQVMAQFQDPDNIQY